MRSPAAVPTMWIALLTLAVQLMFANGVAATDNPCTKDWNMSQNQTQLKCPESAIVDWSLEQIPKVCIPMLVGIGIWIACPFFFCGRYVCNCCGSHKPRPGGGCCGGDYWDGKPEDEVLSAYGEGEIRCVRFTSIALVLLPVGYVLMCFAGATQILASVSDLASGAENLITWVLNDVQQIANTLAPDGNYDSSLTSFVKDHDEVRRTGNDILRDWVQGSIVSDFKALVAGFSYPAFLPAIFVVIGAVMSLMRIRQIVPMLCVLVLFFLAAPFGIGSTVFLVVHAPFSVLCDEVDAQFARAPGVFQNYMVPQCDDISPIAIIKDALDDGQREAADRACTALLNICDSSSSYSAGSPRKWYNCSASAGVCRTAVDAATRVAGAILKPGAGQPCGAATSCTIAQCATQCTGNDQSSTAGILDGVRTAQKIQNATVNSQIITRWSNCNLFFDHVLTELPICEKLPGGVLLIGVGFGLVTLSCLMSIIFLTLGSKRFIDFERYAGGNKAFGAKNAPLNLNAATVVRRAGPPPVVGKTTAVAQDAGYDQPLMMQQEAEADVTLPSKAAASIEMRDMDAL